MRISDRLKTGFPSFSFEFFPPKTSEGEAKLWAAIQELRPLAPSFVSVTYGAGGSTRAKTVALTERIQAELGLDAMAHLTCVGSTKDELAGILAELKERGVHNVLPLRGDPPKGESKFVAPKGGFAYASELVDFVKSQGDFCIGGACYPEGHIEAASKYQDLHALKRKVDAGAEFLITQLFFDNRFYFDFVDRARAAGIHVPIIPGIMPIHNVEQIQRFTKLCGATIPEQLMRELEKRRDQPERVHELGVVHATIQALGLIQGGAPGIHFFTLNQSTATREILTAMRMNARL
ncbi:methylenetetrahydrofolate reductase [NAD(P)H] [Myxococcota bacterium]|nr:methylenetetrahydrofolate reductase [NAD(P)H] [Myxococcota bacterium]